MAHKHSVYDSDTHFTINPVTRALRNNGSTKTTLMQYDHNSERFTFELPKEVEGHDMSKCNVVEIHYLNIDTATKATEKGVYTVTDLQVSPEDENVVIFSWLISQNATKLIGSLNFLVRFTCVENGMVEYVWSTAIHTGIAISSGIYNREIIVEQYADIIEQWRIAIDQTIDRRLMETLAQAEADGAFNGVGIESVEQTTKANGDEGENVLTVTLTDGKQYTVIIRNGSKGDTGDQGIQGIQGIQGEPGVSATHEWDGTVLKITSASGTSSANLKGDKGDKGEPGEKGADGAGITILGTYDTEETLNNAHPTGNVGDGYLVNGHLFVWSDTESAWIDVGNIKGDKGDRGEQGLQGDTGNGIASVTLNADYTLTIKFTDGTEQTTVSIRGEKGEAGNDGVNGKDGANGVDGKDGTNGISITKVEQTTTSTEDGGINVVTVTLSNGQVFTFDVKNGSKGSPYTLTDTDKNTIATAVKNSLTTESWTFTLEDDSTVTKEVYVK